MTSKYRTQWTDAMNLREVRLQDIVIADARGVAELLKEGQIGGIAIGRAEAGPRALGHRSIIASPLSLRAKERINGMVKHRAPFQPLAPVCLTEDLWRFFEEPKATVSLRYMTVALRCKEETLSVAPAIVHADLTARVQAVDELEAPFLASVIREFRDLTGVGILINTSLNARGEPITNSPAESFQAYRALDLDFLVIENYLVTSRLCS